MTSKTDDILKDDDRLTPREMKFVQAYMDGMSCTKAMEYAGYSKQTARTQQARVRNRPRVEKAIIFEYAKRGYILSVKECKLVGINYKKYNDRLMFSLEQR